MATSPAAPLPPIGGGGSSGTSEGVLTAGAPLHAPPLATAEPVIRRSDQLDVPHLDAALLSLLVPRVRSMFKHWRSWRSDSSPGSSTGRRGKLNDGELDSLVHAALAAIATVLTVGCGLPSPAMRVMGLEMSPAVDRRVGDDEYSRGRVMLRRATTLAVFSAVIPALFRIMESRCGDDDEGDGRRGEGEGESRYRNGGRIQGRGAGRQPSPLTTTAATMESLARRRRKSILRFLVRLAAMIVPPLRLANYLAFLFHNRPGNNQGRITDVGETPVQPSASLPMRLAGLTYTPAATAVAGPQSSVGERHVNFSYAYRRILYEEAYALAAIMLLPSARAAAAMIPILRAWVGRLGQRMAEAARRAMPRALTLRGIAGVCRAAGEPCGEGEDVRCPVCSRPPFDSSVPYKPQPCGHVHCYVCLRTAALDHPRYRCRRCGTAVESSGPA